MYLKNLFGLYFLFVCFHSFCQGDNYEWFYRLGTNDYEKGKAVCAKGNNALYVTTFNNSLSIGGNHTTQGGYDVLIFEVDTASNVIWSKQIGGSGLDECNAILYDNLNNVIWVAVSFTSSFIYDAVTISSAPLPQGVCFLKLNSTGQLISYSVIPSQGDFTIHNGGMDSDANTYWIGTFSTSVFPLTDTITNAGGFYDAFVIKIGVNNNISWYKHLSGTGSEFYGGITVNSTPNVFIGGMTSSNDFTIESSVFDANASDSYFAKLDTSGNLVFLSRITGAGSEEIRDMKSVGTDIYVTGGYSSGFSFGSTTLPTANGTDGFIIKIDEMCQPLWAKNMTSPGVTRMTKLCLDNSGNPIVAGNIGGSCSFGQTGFIPNTGGIDFGVICYKPSGDPLWWVYGTGTSDDEPGGISVNNLGEVYMAGTSNSGTVLFDTHFYNQIGNDDILIGRLRNPQNSIALGSFTSNTICTETNFVVTFIPDDLDHFLLGNSFSVILSDASGNFNAGTNIGYVTSLQNTDTIVCRIPASVPFGTGYRIRVQSTNPEYISNDNGYNITVFPHTSLVMNFVNGTTICEGTSTLISATNGFSSYEWSDGSGGNTHSAYIDSDYFVNAHDMNGCRRYSDTAHVTVIPKHIEIEGDLQFCYSDYTQLTAPSISGASYFWTNGYIGSSQTFTTSQDCQLQIFHSNGCVSTSDTLEIKAIVCNNYMIEGFDSTNVYFILPCDSGVIIGGEIDLFGGFKSAYIGMLDTLGNRLWEKKIRKGSSDEKVVQGMISSDSYLYILTQSMAGAGIIKLDFAGDTVWTKYVYTGFNQKVCEIVESPSGAIYVSGTYDGSLNHSGTVTSLLKIWPNAYIEWFRETGCPHNLSFTADGHLFSATAAANPPMFGYAMTLLDTNGNYIWNKIGAESTGWSGKKVISLPDSTLLLLARNYYSFCVTKYTSQGVFKWAKGYELNNEQFTCEGGGVLENGNLVLLGVDNENAYILITDSYGDPIKCYYHPVSDFYPSGYGGIHNNSLHYIMSYDNTQIVSKLDLDNLITLCYEEFPLDEVNTFTNQLITSFSNPTVYPVHVFSTSRTTNITNCVRQQNYSCGGSPIVDFFLTNTPTTGSICEGIFDISFFANPEETVNLYYSDLSTFSTIIANNVPSSDLFLNWNIPGSLVGDTIYIIANGNTTGLADTIGPYFIQALPAVNAGVDQSACYGSPVNLNGYVTGGTYRWYPSNLVVNPTALNTSVNTSSPTDFILRVKNGNCVNSDTVTINIYNSSEPSLICDTLLCQFDTLHFEVYSTGTTISWTPTTGLSDPSSFFTNAYPLNSTTYHYTITDPLGCSNFSDSISITVLTSPSAPTINILGPFQLQCSVTAPAYEWFQNGIPMGINSQILNISTTGDYSVVVYNASNCASLPSTPIYIQDAKVPINDITIEVFPNPFNSEIIVKFETYPNSKTTIYFFDLTGRLIHTETLNGARTNINSSNWTNGAYLYKIINEKVSKGGIIIKSGE